MSQTTDAGRKAALELEKLELEVQEKRRALARAQGDDIAGALPDLSSARWSTTTSAKDGAVVHGAPLAATAVTAAAARVRAVVEGWLNTDTYTIVVTTEPDMSARQAAYESLLERVTTLDEQIQAVLSPPSEPGQRSIAGGAAMLLAPVAGKALGAAFSLLRTTSTLTTSSQALDDQVASWAVAGALADASKSACVYIDGMLPLAAESALVDAVSGLRESIAALRAHVASLDDGEPSREQLAALLAAATEADTALDKPGVAGPSPLDAARAYEWLAENEVPVLAVKGGQTSVDQLVRERLSAKVTVLAAASMAYLLVTPAQGWRVRKAGVAHGKVHLTGELGKVLSEQ